MLRTVYSTYVCLHLICVHVQACFPQMAGGDDGWTREDVAELMNRYVNRINYNKRKKVHRDVRMQLLFAFFFNCLLLRTFVLHVRFFLCARDVESIAYT